MNHAELMEIIQPIINEQTKLNIDAGIQIGMEAMRKIVLKYFEQFTYAPVNVEGLNLAMQVFIEAVKKGKERK